jgi:hypothetical protein
MYQWFVLMDDDSDNDDSDADDSDDDMLLAHHLHL